MIFSRIKQVLELNKVIKAWNAANSHNHCTIEKVFDISKVSVGRESYGVINPYFYGNPDCRLTIGSYCSIGEGTRFVYGEHDYHHPSTFPFNYYVLGKEEINPIKGPIVLEDDVWIGMNCIILSGVTIHQGAVIGAGSIVTKDVPPYAIFAGGRVIKKRFDEATIEKLLKLDYSKLTPQMVKDNVDMLYHSVDDNFFKSELYNNISRR